MCFVDGFNLYHAIDDMRRPELKWLCLTSLARQFVDPTRETLAQVRYYSALATHRTPQAVERHRIYIQALQHMGVETILGRFKKKMARCKACEQQYPAHEEKETDVNLAVDLSIMGLTGQWDTALLVSNDSDFASTVKAILARAPTKQIRILTPPGRHFSRDLKTASGRDARKIQPIHLERSQLPDTVPCISGPVSRPSEWEPTA